MSRHRSISAPPSAPSAAPTDDTVAKLTEAVETLSQQVQVLTDVLDQVREELNWALNNRDEFRCESRYNMHITSMPKDPCAPDFGERVNRYTAKDLPPELQPSPPPATGPAKQGSLFT